MPTMTFTTGPDTYTVSGAGNFDLSFLAGNDTLTVNGGTSTLAHMGDDDDIIRLLLGAATVYGDLGVDTFSISALNVTAHGGDGNDVFNLRGGSGQSVYGDEGDDLFTFIEGVSNITLNGGIGNDEFNGRNKIVTGSIYGDAGNDSFVNFRGGGAVSLYGGLGDDVYRVGTFGAPTFVELSGEGTDSAQVTRGFSYALAANIENLSVGDYTGSTTDPATLTGNVRANVINGSGNNETLYGLGGSDKLNGLGGNDTLDGGSGTDILDGGVGNDHLYDDGGADFLIGGTGDDYMEGGIGNDTYYVDSLGDQVVEAPGEGTDLVRVTVSNFVLSAEVENGVIYGSGALRLDGNGLDNILKGGGGGDSLYGLGGNDSIQGASGADLLDGGAGNDTVLGGTGRDTMYGGADNDVLNGGTSNDKLYGGAGTDSLTGGANRDTFYFTSTTDSLPGAADSITDFTSTDGAGANDDTIDLSGIDANTSSAGDQAFTYNGLAPAAHSAWLAGTPDGSGGFNWVLFGDVNGDTTADFELHFHSGTDFGLDDIVW